MEGLFWKSQWVKGVMCCVCRVHTDCSGMGIATDLGSGVQ